MVLRAGIELPLMYRMGYDNANCIGCVKGGEGSYLSAVDPPTCASPSVTSAMVLYAERKTYGLLVRLRNGRSRHLRLSLTRISP